MKSPLGTRLETGARVGVCPSCHKIATRGLEVILLGLPPDVPPAINLIATHTGTRQCVSVINRPLNVQEAALLCGLRPVAIYAAVARGNLIATRREGWPIVFEVADFARYFNSTDRRHNRYKKVKIDADV
jgi:hypothetical protein